MSNVGNSLNESDIWSLYQPSQKEVDEIQKQLDKKTIDEALVKNTSGTSIFKLSDGLQFITQGMQVLVEDQFTKCFQSPKVEQWNWNAYLFPAWCLGVIFRYCFLFPLRLFCLLLGGSIFFILFFALFIIPMRTITRERYQRYLIQFLCHVFVMSWSGVIKIHGTRPRRHPNQVFVANHTSIIDVVILSQSMCFAIVGQKHPGFMGFMQDKVLSCLGGIWFNRSESKDRIAVAKKITEHIKNPNNNPLLIFPEGVCVNNEYCVMFKKGAFELDATIYPVAIKYNKLFVDAFWNSRQQTIWHHLFNLMTSWAVVCDVWYMDPQRIQPGETPEQFANRVKAMIAKKAGLINVPWDGYLKYFRPSARFTEHKQRVFAAGLIKRCGQQDLIQLRLQSSSSKDSQSEKSEESATTKLSEERSDMMKHSNTDLQHEKELQTKKDD